MKIDGLPDAIVDGKLVVPAGHKIIVLNEIDGRQVPCVYLIKKINDDGWVFAWDETTVHCRSFKLTDSIVAKIMPEGGLQ